MPSCECLCPAGNVYDPDIFLFGSPSTFLQLRSEPGRRMTNSKKRKPPSIEVSKKPRPPPLEKKTKIGLTTAKTDGILDLEADDEDLIVIESKDWKMVLEELKVLKNIVNQQQTRLEILEKDNLKQRNEIYYLAESNEIKENIQRKNNILLKKTGKTGKTGKKDVISDLSKTLKKSPNEITKLVKYVKEDKHYVKVGLKPNDEITDQMHLSFKRDLAKVTRVKKYVMGKFKILST